MSTIVSGPLDGAAIPRTVVVAAFLAIFLAVFLAAFFGAFLAVFFFAAVAMINLPCVDGERENGQWFRYARRLHGDHRLGVCRMQPQELFLISFYRSVCGGYLAQAAVAGIEQQRITVQRLGYPRVPVLRRRFLLNIIILQDLSQLHQN
jgi:hypothetical protein